MPQPRPAPAIVPPAAPAIASKPPVGAVVAKAPAACRDASDRDGRSADGCRKAAGCRTNVPPRPSNQHLRPQSRPLPRLLSHQHRRSRQHWRSLKPRHRPHRLSKHPPRRLPKLPRKQRKLPQHQTQSQQSPRLPFQQAPEATPAPARPVVAPRRVVMPQTGPRPVYKAPIVAASTVPLLLPHRGGAFSAASRSSIAGLPAHPAAIPAAHAWPRWTSRPVPRRGPRPKHPTPHRICRPWRRRCTRRTSRIWRTPRIRRSASRRLWRRATWRRRRSADRRGAASAARAAESRPPRRPAVSQDQGRPDEGLCAAAAFWRRHTVQRRAACPSRAKSP